MTTEALFDAPDWASLSPYNVADNECADVLRQVQIEQAGRRTACAARAAARAAAWAAMRPTVERLQQSCVELIRRMCEVK